MIPPRLSVVCPDAELVLPVDSGTSDLILYLRRIDIILGKSVMSHHGQGALLKD